jgi:hypothetical protein
VIRRWGLLLLCVASLAGNVYLYLGLHSKSATSGSQAPAHPASPPPSADRRVAARTGGAPAPTIRPQSSGADAVPTLGSPPPPKTYEECSRIRREAFRARLRDPAQRNQIKEETVAATRSWAESDGGLADLHLSEEQLTRIYELSADWELQSAESNDPQARDGWPPQQNPLIAAELGIEVAEKWAKHRREANGRFEVREIAGRIASNDVPLTAEQRRRMVELYTALAEDGLEEARGQVLEPPTNEAEAIEWHQGNKEQNVRHGNKLLERAATILSAKQLEVLRRDSDQRAADRERQWEQQRSQGQLVHKDADGCVTSWMP